ncbi:conjugal transfer protein [Desemzia sp. C1]|uniref:TrsD/TraD family conjugative transfer protein n=1 Tax=Desemzia sp. C1 TaxID=2892016 RepID=UPI001E5962E0|nr:TrsD/TraD family conjugative transfer protein [Desemzia sp. C1]MCI3027544.1 conjugal transfer protein [Desemzia sp. C1]
MFGFGKKKKDTQKENKLEFTFKPRPINKGKETIDDMSLIKSIYQGYIVTKTGYLVAIIETTGINLELLSEEEQTYTFEAYNTFLMNTLGDSSKEKQQYLDITMPVNFDDYILAYKKRYLEENNPARKQLIASYIDYFNNKVYRNEMSTKRHLLVIREKITDKSLTSLDKKVSDLDEKVNHYINRLEDAFEQHDLQAKKLYGDEIIAVLKNLFNYNGK